MTEWEKMGRGELFDTFDPDLMRRRARARALCDALNATPMAEVEARRSLLVKLFGSGGDTVQVESSFHCDYGENITLGPDVSFNFNCVVLDVCPVRIGQSTLIGPGVQIVTPEHTLLNRGPLKMHGEAVSIGSDCWIAAGTLILPGVTIGDGTVIGAGSVVTNDIGPGVLAYGNPCRVEKKIPDRRTERTSSCASMMRGTEKR